MRYNFKILKKLRLKHGKPTQEEISKVLKCSRANYSKIENGEFISLEQLEMLANYYKIDLSELFKFTGNEKVIQETSKSPPGWTFDSEVREEYNFLTKVVSEANEEAKAGYSADTLCRNIIKDMEKQLIKIKDELKKTNWCLK